MEHVELMAGESIYLGDSIQLKILRVRGTLVDIGIDAPLDVKVLRGELTEFVADSPLSRENIPLPSESLSMDIQPCRRRKRTR